jgi:hypothetical protein
MPVNLTKYGEWYGANGVEWCAEFVSWCFAEAGMPLAITTPKGFAYCPFAVTWFKQHNAWFHRDEPALPGDCVLYDWNGDGLADHTGIVVSAGITSITAIEGNTSPSNNTNGGSVMLRNRDYSLILGYGRPAYGAAMNAQVDACKVPGRPGQHWVVTTDGGVRALPAGAAPFYGSYPGLPDSAKQGQRSFIAIEANDPHDASKGYTIFGDDDTQYSFPTGS